MNAPSDRRPGEGDPGTDPPASDLVAGESSVESDLVPGEGPLSAEKSDLITEKRDLVAADAVTASAEKSDLVTADTADDDTTDKADDAADPPDPAPAVGPPRDFRRLLRRFGPAVVAIGIAVFASPLASRWPSKQTVEIALDAPGGVTRVSLDVTPRGEQEPVYTAAWTFDPGTAPQRISAEWSAPDGRYDATIGVVRVGAAPSDETKHIDLDGNRITLFPR